MYSGSTMAQLIPRAAMKPYCRMRRCPSQATAMNAPDARIINGTSRSFTIVMPRACPACPSLPGSAAAARAGVRGGAGPLRAVLRAEDHGAVLRAALPAVRRDVRELVGAVARV